MKPTEEKDEESLTQSLVQKNESVGVVQGMKNCFYLLTTPKFVLLTFTMFANGYYMSIGWSVGYIALFVPSQMNRQTHDSIFVGILMSLYACM